jgi:hypothetical protein
LKIRNKIANITKRGAIAAIGNLPLLSLPFWDCWKTIG